MTGASPTRLGVLFALLALLVAAGVNPAFAGATGEETEPCTFASAGNTTVDGPQPHLDIAARRLPGETAGVRYRVAFDLPPGTTDLSVRAWNGSWVGKTAGFVGTDGRWAWNGSGRPRLTLTVPAETDGPGWTFAHAPLVAYRWTTDGTTRCASSMADGAQTTVDTPAGVSHSTSGTHVLLSRGPHASLVERAANTTYRLVYDRSAVPDTFDPSAVRRTIDRTATRLAVNASAETVTVFALPPGPDRSGTTAWMSWATERRTVWLDAREPMGVPGGVLTHELVHAHQSFDVSPRLRWLVEGSARYYSVLVPLAAAGDHRRLGAYVASDLFAEGAAGEATRLADRDTWRPGTPYDEGARALLELDARLRAASGGTATARDLFRWLNGRDGEVDYAAFRRAVVRFGDDDVGAWLDRHVLEGDAYESLPPGEAHPFAHLARRAQRPNNR